MPDDNSPIRTTTRVESEKFFSIYCNNAQMGLTPWDVRIEFNELLGVGAREEKVILMRHGTVVMSPAHAKVLLKALTETVQKYESTFGFIDTAQIEAAVTRPNP